MTETSVINLINQRTRTAEKSNVNVINFEIRDIVDVRGKFSVVF